MYEKEWDTVQQKEKNRTLIVAYPNYQKVGEQFFPKEIGIQAQDRQNTTQIVVDYKEVVYNAKVSFPFKIPAGAKQIKIKWQ